MTKYKNPWHKPGDPDSKKFFETKTKPKKYRGYLIYEVVKGKQFDVVQDGVCVTQLAGPTGAKLAVDKMVIQKLLDTISYAESIWLDVRTKSPACKYKNAVKVEVSDAEREFICQAKNFDADELIAALEEASAIYDEDFSKPYKALDQIQCFKKLREVN